MRSFLIISLVLSLASVGYSAPKHRRDSSLLSLKDKEFAEQLSIRQRKIFCGQFNYSQREAAIKYAKGRGMDKCYTPDEAVAKVMEETGMSLAVKSRPELDHDSE